MWQQWVGVDVTTRRQMKRNSSTHSLLPPQWGWMCANGPHYHRSKVWACLRAALFRWVCEAGVEASRILLDRLGGDVQSPPQGTAGVTTRWQTKTDRKTTESMASCSCKVDRMRTGSQEQVLKRFKQQREPGERAQKHFPAYISLHWEEQLRQKEQICWCKYIWICFQFSN